MTIEFDGNPGSQSKYLGISMMPQFRDRSLEELRYEDYAAGHNQPLALSAAATPASNGLFGAAPQSQPAGGMFSAASASAFGQSSAFGAPQNSTQPAFGAPSSASGLFGAAPFGTSNVAAQTTTASGFGAPAASAFGAPQPSAASTGMFGAPAPAASNPFGAAAAQPAAFGSTPAAFGQSASSLFGQPAAAANPAMPAASQQMFGQTGATLFGSQPAGAPSSLFGQQPPAQSAPGLFGVASTPAVFGSVPAAASAPSLFGAPAAAVAPAAPPGGLFGAPAAAASGFGATAPAVGLSLPGVGGLGQAQPQQQLFGQNPAVPQVAAAQPGPGALGMGIGAVPGVGSNPTLADSYNAVMLHNGTTIAPAGANYGTILYNLQKLQNDIGEHNRRLAEQQKQMEPAGKTPSSRHVIVMPPPQLVKIATNRLSLSSSRMSNGSGSGGGAGGGARMNGTLRRTPMRGVASRAGGGAGRVSGTPARDGMRTEGNGVSFRIEAHDERPRDGSESMPFFTPKQFSGAKRRPLRASQLSTPLRMATLITPAKKSTERGAVGGKEVDQRQPKDLVPDTPLVEMVPPSMNGDWSGAENGAENRDIRGENGFDGNGERSDENPEMAKEENTDSEPRRESSNFLWSAKRPSQWSLNIGLTSPYQYDASKYLPTNTRPDYFSFPTNSELAVRTMTECQRVEGFTVGRHGFGKIEWIEPVDIRGLQIDVCVEISHGEVSVFPDQEASQLNAPAVITLEGMLPKIKKNWSDVEMRALYDRYSKKLQRYCVEKHVKFISYDGEKGVWVFQVKDFSE